MQRSFAFGPFVLDSARGTLTRDGAVVPLGTRSLALLGALLRAGNGVVDKWELMEAAWPHAAVEESNLSVQIAGLRKLLGNQPDGGPWIVTVARAGYRFAGTIEESDSMPAAASRPLVSVLPLVDASAGRDSEILAATLREDIAAALVSFRWLRVTQRGDAAAKYEVHGSLREAGPLRLAIRVTDTKSGTTLLARTFEAGTAAASDDLPRRIAAAIEPTLLQAEGAPGRGRSAVDHVRSGIGLFHRLSPATHHRARECFRLACRLDSGLAEARIWLARVSAGLVAYGWSDDPAADAEEGVRAGLEGVRLDDGNPYAHYGLALASIYAGAIQEAIAASQRAIELSDSFALGHLALGLSLLASGDAVGAVRLLARGLELSPGDPQHYAWLNFLARAQLLSGEVAAARDTAARLLRARPDWRPGVQTMIACLEALERFEDAARARARLATLAESSGDALGPVRRAFPAGVDAPTRTGVQPEGH